MDSLAKVISEWIIRRSVHKGPIPWENVRDICDLQTGSELGSIALNILTDMVVAKLPKEMVDDL